MKYQIEARINDGKTEAPPVEVETENPWHDFPFIAEWLTNDYGEPLGVGSTLTITRIA